MLPGSSKDRALPTDRHRPIPNCTSAVGCLVHLPSYPVGCIGILRTNLSFITTRSEKLTDSAYLAIGFRFIQFRHVAEPVTFLLTRGIGSKPTKTAREVDMTDLIGSRIPMGTIGTIPTGSEPHPLSTFVCIAPSGFPVPGMTERRHAAPLRALESPHTIRCVGLTDRGSLGQPAGPAFDDFQMSGIEREHRRGVALSRRRCPSALDRTGAQQ